VDISKQQKINK